MNHQSSTNAYYIIILKMSKFLSRIGSTGEKYTCSVKLHRISMTLGVPANLGVIWKMRSKRLETTGNIALGTNTGTVEVNEILQMMLTIYKNSKSDVYLAK
jgi:hypothetical protein